MLSEFLSENKKEIIKLCKTKVLEASESKPTSALLDAGLPIFYDEVIEVLQRTSDSPNSDNHTFTIERFTQGDAAAHGKESLRLGYTISQVVHAYGAVCQCITEYAQFKSQTITPQEFRDFNLSLDLVIAEAVTEFNRIQKNNTQRNETERLGFLIHEMGNSLAAASIALAMIQKGHVGTAGNTSKMLVAAHDRMRHLIDSSLAEVRMSKHTVERGPIRLLDLINEVEATAFIQAKSKTISLVVEVDPTVHFTADHHLIYSALSNIVNNAIKFSKKFGHISIRGKSSGEHILIEVEDECGGLPDENTEELFKSFIQKGTDRTGMGLGLSLSRRAIELNQGELTARNLPGKGCIFTIHLPTDKK